MSTQYKFSFLEEMDADIRSTIEINELISQMTDRTEAQINPRQLTIAICSNQSILVVRDGASIIAMGRVCLIPPLMCIECEIHDVVVDGKYRGQGIAREIVNLLLREAKDRYSAVQVSLTSRPEREAANALYKSMGFVHRETNCYRYTFEKEEL